MQRPSAIVFSATPLAEAGFCPVTRFPSAMLNAWSMRERGVSISRAYA
ncbi:hypothetical protein [Nostoc sp.]